MINRALSPLARSVANLFARGAVTRTAPGHKMQTIQAALLEDESKDAIEHFEPYGFTSHPKPGAEVLAAFLEGDRSHGVIVVAADRRYRVKNLQAGELAIYDDLGHKITLTRSGIVIDGAGHAINVVNCPQVVVTGGDVIADGISLKTHKHGGVQAGAAQTGVPV